ncbi:uncharacterized protein LOC141713770 [Apium graveolens]|uniref:uncharacterized protein LOC141713770 n=1 Tax=Apium graveolens TaxID=4045 RepID=UPI003D7AF24C
MARKISLDVPKMKEGVVRLSYPMLAKNNYTTWSLKMKVFMRARGVWEAIENSDPKDVIYPRQVNVALTSIYQGISEDILLSVAEKETTKEAWDSIKIMCIVADHVQKAKVQTFRSEFEALNMKVMENIDDFSMKLTNIVSNIRALGDKVEQSCVVKKLLRAVSTKFLQIASTVEQFGDLDNMSVTELIGRLRVHEERIRGHVKDNGNQLLLT